MIPVMLFLSAQVCLAGGEVKRGAVIDAKGAITPKEMLAKMEKDKKFEGKIETKVNSCCKKKGCWMMVDLGDGKEMRVSFKDYAFFVPLESAGKNVIMQGRASYDTTTVAMLHHYASDAGKSKKEIDAITQPEISITFEADGVILTDDKKKK